MDKKKYRVLHLMTGFGGGISAFILNKAEELANSDIEFNVLTFDVVSERFRNAIENTGGKIYKITNPEENGQLKMIQDYNQVLNHFDREVIIHSHFGMNLVVPFYFMSRLKKIKRFVIHAHTGAPYRLNDRKRKLNRFFAKEKISAGIKCSENTFGMDSPKEDAILHIPNSIDPNRYLRLLQNEEELKEELFGNENLGKKIIGHVGRFHHVKNHEFMINLIERLSKTDEKFLWVFVGDGDLREEIEEEVVRRNLSSFVKFMGWQNDTSIFFKLFDLFVLPSFYEGLPTVAIESQAAGTPVILSDRITNEVDLDLDLVKFLSLNHIEDWIKTVQSSKFPSPSVGTREKVLIEKKFTNDMSAQLYKEFIEGKIKSYTI